jgi:hypothetical protein
MNAFIDHKPALKDLASDTLIEWTIDIDRVSRAAREAFRTETPDPWTRIEAECIVQLIDAELIAMDTRRRRGEAVQAAIRHLKALRTETVLAIKTLESVEREVGPERTEHSPAESSGALGHPITQPSHSLLSTEGAMA